MNMLEDHLGFIPDVNHRSYTPIKRLTKRYIDIKAILETYILYRKICNRESKEVMWWALEKKLIPCKYGDN